MNKKYRGSWRSKDFDSLRCRAEQHHIPIISPATQQFLGTLLQQIRPVQVLEIGTAVGYSTCFLANQLIDRQWRISSFEVSAPSYHTALCHRELLQARNSSIYHLDVLQAPLSNLGVYELDFVFVDGMKIQYTAYLKAIRPYCIPGCVIVCDDIVSQQDKMETLRPYLEKQGLSHEIKHLTDGDGIVIIKT